MNPLKVLLVDDDYTSLVVTKAILESEFANIRIAMARDGYEALDSFRDSPVDVILMDFRMPYLDGGRTAKALREDGRHVPVILLTASAEANVNSAGAVDLILNKPFSKQDLVSAVASFSVEVSRTEFSNSLLSFKAELGEEGFNQILKAFLESSKAFTDEYRRHYADKNLDMVQSVAHRFKSSASALKLHNLMFFCRKIEESSSMSVCDRAFRQLEEHLFDILSWVKSES